jgi:hypothetical protein
MKNILIAFLLALPPLAYAQAIPFEQRGPIISVTGSAAYMFGQSFTGHDRSLWGWSVAPEWNLTPRVGLVFECAGFSMESITPGQNRLFCAAGPKYNFATRLTSRYRVVPFIFGEGGEMRLTTQGSIYRDWDPIGVVGVGFKRRLTTHIDITVVPGEYLLEAEDDGLWSHNFAARAGFSYNFYHR